MYSKGVEVDVMKRIKQKKLRGGSRRSRCDRRKNKCLLQQVQRKKGHIDVPNKGVEEVVDGFIANEVLQGVLVGQIWMAGGDKTK